MAVITYKNIQDRTLELLGKSDAVTRARVKNWINMGQNDFIFREHWPFRDATDFPTDTNDLELVADNDESLIPLEYREALVHYGLSLEHDYNTDPDLAQKASNRYEQILSLARQNLLAQDFSDFEMQGPLSTVNWTEINESNFTVEG